MDILTGNGCQEAVFMHENVMYDGSFMTSQGKKTEPRDRMACRIFTGSMIQRYIPKGKLKFSNRYIGINVLLIL